MTSFRLLHVVATGARRGSEVFASDLVGALSGEVDQRVAVLHHSGSMHVSFSSAPVSVITNDGLLRWGVSAGGVVGLRSLINSFKPDVIQAHGGESLKSAVLGDASHGKRLVYRRIGSADGRGLAGVRLQAHSRLMRRPRQVVAVADAVRREAIDLFGIPWDRVVTIPNGVDPGRLAPQTSKAETLKALGIPPGAPVLLSLGALNWEKAPLVHLDVFKRVISELPDAVHLFVGEGSLRKALESEARAAGLGERVRVLGSRDDVADLLAIADVLLVASSTEGMPACAIEAGIAGVPVVSYELAGMPEIVRHGDTGYLVTPGDIDGLARAVTKVCQDSACAWMGEAARRHCRRRFGIASIAPRYLRVYEHVLATAR